MNFAWIQLGDSLLSLFYFKICQAFFDVSAKNSN